MSIPWLIDVLRAAGVRVVEEGDWRNRARAGAFDPIGVLWHHTAATSSPSNPAPALGIVINGRPDLPGPLCHALVDYNGVFHLISAGRANHAGASRGSGPIPAGDGNALMIGWEIDYNGVGQSMTGAQYDASVLATAAVLKRLGRNASYARGHRETSTTGKPDPGGINLDTMRADVAAALAGQGSGAGGGAAVYAGGRYDVFGINAAGTLYQKIYQGGSWSAWNSLGGVVRGTPAATLHDGRFDVFAVGADGAMRQKLHNPGGAWSAWINLGGDFT